MERQLEYVRRLLVAIAGVALLVMAVAGAVDVIAPQLFNVSVPWVYEFIALLTVWVTWLPMGEVQAAKRHIVIGVFLSWLPESPRRVLKRVLPSLAGVAVGVLIILASAAESWKSVQILETMGTTDFPVYPSRVAFFVGAVVLMLSSLIRLLARRDDEADGAGS